MKFAKAVNFFARGSLTMIGHYSELGEQIRTEILPGHNVLDMFWLITKERAHGGRAALLPLARVILTKRAKNVATPQNTLTEESCNQDCKTVKSAFIRSASLITNSKTVELSKSK